MAPTLTSLLSCRFGHSARIDDKPSAIRGEKGARGKKNHQLLAVPHPVPSHFDGNDLLSEELVFSISFGRGESFATREAAEADAEDEIRPGSLKGIKLSQSSFRRTRKPPAVDLRPTLMNSSLVEDDLPSDASSVEDNACELQESLIDQDLISSLPLMLAKSDLLATPAFPIAAAVCRAASRSLTSSLNGTGKGGSLRAEAESAPIQSHLQQDHEDLLPIIPNTYLYLSEPISSGPHSRRLKS